MRKLTVDNSVRSIPRNEKTKERDIKPKTIKAGTLLRRQNKNILQSKKIPKNVTASGFGKLK